MLKELSWYIETNRFTNIVEEIEEKAAAYSEALKTDSENKEELRDDLRTLCQWHMEKSGYKTESVPYINIDLEFFDGHDINRAALSTFEKEIIKAHMYQKHLWEFMGTTGSMTVISKTAMRQDGFVYESYLPLEYKKTHNAKSPISNILEENPDAVPIYIYPDGSVSGEYNPEKSKFRLDALRDKSGFDWTRKGWNPNYEVHKEGWHGEYDETGTWTMVREGKGEYEKTSYTGARFEKLPEIEILKDGDRAILYDPNYSLISTFERIFLLTDGNIYGVEQEDAEKTVSLIKEAMDEMGIKSIKAICGGDIRPDTKRLNPQLLMEKSVSEAAPAKKTAIPSRQRKGQKITNERILSFYKKLFGEALESNAEVASYKEYRKTKKELAEKAESKRTEESGRSLSEKIAIVKASGTEGEELIRAIQTEKTKIPLSVFNSVDKKESGLTDEEFNIIQNYAVPEHKKELFSRAILNLLVERETIRTSGKEVRELFDTVYADVVEGKKSDEAISVETTFSELCSNPDKSLGAEPVDSTVMEKLTEAKRNLPEQKTQELQKKVDAAVDNIIRNFSAVRMSTGMTPEEAVKLAAKTVGGKDSAVFVPPASGIVYQTPAMNAPFNARNGGDKRIFSDIRIADLIEKSKNLPPPTKEIEVERLIAESRQSATVKGLASGERETETGTGLTHKEESGADKAYAETGKAQEPYASLPNLFNKKEREAWYKTESFRKTGLSVSDVENLVQSEEEKIQGLKPSADKNVVTFSKTKELDREMGYSTQDAEQNRNATFAKIVPIMQSRNTEETVRELNEKLKSADISSEYKAAEINANGRLSRELAGAVTQADFARERNRIIFGEDVQQNVPAKKGDGKPLNTLATPKAEKTENSPTPYQSAREQARSQILTETTEAITASNVSKYTKGGQIFPADYNSGTESHVSVQEKHGTGTRHNAELAASDITAGSDAGIIGESQFYKESTPSLSVRTEAVHHTEDMRFNAADSVARKSFIGNEPAYSTAANNASNDTFTEKTTQNAQTSSESRTSHTAPTSNESRAAYTVQPTSEDWNAAAETGASYTSVHSREDGSSAKKTGQNPSQPRGDISGQTKQMLTPEQEEAARLERMNANYEHDRAVLAKTDPLFARNEFWEVGHAEGSGEESDREIKMATKKLQENMLEKIKGKQL